LKKHTRSACMSAAVFASAALAVAAVALPMPTPPTGLSINGSAPTPPVTGGTAFLAGAYQQLSFQGLSMNQNTGRYTNGGFSSFEGTDAITGITQGATAPVMGAFWGGGTPAHPTQIQLIQSAEGDQTRQILTGATLPAGSLPGSGNSENYYRNTFVAPYNANVGGQSGNTMQNNYMLWPASGNVGKMYYHRQWMRISSLAGVSFFTVSENKTGGSTLRTGLNINTSSGQLAWGMLADHAPSGGGYGVTWQDTFNPSTHPVPIGVWFLVEFATRPGTASNSFAWAAINGVVLQNDFLYQSVSAPYVNGAHMGNTRVGYGDEDVTRIYNLMAYSDQSRPPSQTVDFARYEIWDHFPPDASTPHP
jgi:hypothetical protein